MGSTISLLVVAAIAGAAMVTGLLFAFSNFVMRSLAEVPGDHGMFAMQQINEKIQNPVFFTFFFGTPLLCLLVGLYSFFHLGESYAVFLFLGSLAYLIGPFGITVRYNVPLNEKLAQVSSSEDSDFWQEYQVDWQKWNHIRTYVGLAAIILLSLGLRAMAYA